MRAWPRTGRMQRRAFVRFFACAEDFSHEPPETELPKEEREGKEPLMVVGAMAGGWGNRTLDVSPGSKPGSSSRLQT